MKNNESIISSYKIKQIRSSESPLPCRTAWIKPFNMDGDCQNVQKWKSAFLLEVVMSSYTSGIGLFYWASWNKDTFNRMLTTLPVQGTWYRTVLFLLPSVHNKMNLLSSWGSKHSLLQRLVQLSNGLMETHTCSRYWSGRLSAIITRDLHYRFGWTSDERRNIPMARSIVTATNYVSYITMFHLCNSINEDATVPLIGMHKNITWCNLLSGRNHPTIDYLFWLYDVNGWDEDNLVLFPIDYAVVTRRIVVTIDNLDDAIAIAVHKRLWLLKTFCDYF
jgi:hypothetical protein